MPSPRPRLHLIANSHLDPVWLWDWQEGLTEAITTIRSIIKLMEAFPEITYIRGESVLYEHILREDPATFARIQALVGEGRWEIVGGTYLQPDSNLPATETLIRHFHYGQRFFQERFGRRAQVAWQADCFGHSAGLPEILHHGGIRYFTFFRPQPTKLPMPGPAFWWQGPGGHRVLAYRPPMDWYGCNREQMPERLDHCLKELENGPLPLLACFYGLGNHGGGPSRRHVLEIRNWIKAHPEVEVIHSRLHAFFRELEAATQSSTLHLPVHEGELNFSMRGTYSATMRLKQPYRRAESALRRIERGQAALAMSHLRAWRNLDDLWKDLLFNSFHDILPGTSSERATDEQIQWLHGTRHRIRQEEFHLFNELARLVDTTVPPPAENDFPAPVPVLAFNPHPQPLRMLLEAEVAMDYRPLFAYRDRPDEVPVVVTGPGGRHLPWQRIAVEHNFMPHLPWRQRVLFHADLPPLGWAVYTVGLGAKPAAAPRKPSQSLRVTNRRIASDELSVGARPGAQSIRLTHRGKALFGGVGLSLATMEDPWGCWGDHYGEPGAFDLSTVRHRWNVIAVKAVESGPLRASLQVELAGGASRAEITFRLDRRRPVVEAQARIFWHERNARLKLLMPGVTVADFDVPGGQATRRNCGEAPGSRWVWARGGKGRSGFGLASDGISNFSLSGGVLGATLLRAHPYASSEPNQEGPVADEGPYSFRFLLTPQRAGLETLAGILDEPPMVRTVSPGPGTLERRGTLFSLTPAAGMRVLALMPGERDEEWVLRLQSLGRRVQPACHWPGQSLPLPPLPAGHILDYLLHQRNGRWEVSLPKTRH